MTAIPFDVAEAFLVGEPARRGAFHTDGQQIWSYGLLLADRGGDGVRFRYERLIDGGIAPSAATHLHMVALESAVCESRFPVETVPEYQTSFDRTEARRLPSIGGCGRGLALAVAFAGVGETGTALEHVIGCPECRDFFDRLGEAARVAHQEADIATPHAELVTVAA